MKELIDTIAELRLQHEHARRQYATIGDQLNKLEPKLERSIKDALNKEFQAIAGKMNTQIISNKLRIWVERSSHKEGIHEFKFGKMWVSVTYPLDDYVGSYKGKVYARWDVLEPKIKKFIKSTNIDKCFADGYF